MTPHRPPREIPSWSLDARAVAWFQAWLRAVRAHDDALRVLAERELRCLGLQVAPVREEARP